MIGGTTMTFNLKIAAGLGSSVELGPYWLPLLFSQNDCGGTPAFDRASRASLIVPLRAHSWLLGYAEMTALFHGGPSSGRHRVNTSSCHRARVPLVVPDQCSLDDGKRTGRVRPVAPGSEIETNVYGQSLRGSAMQKSWKPFTVLGSTRIAPRQFEPPGLPLRLLFSLSLLGSIPHLSLAADDQPKVLPPHVERVLRWLPEDTETLIVARSVTLLHPGPDVADSWEDFGAYLATCALDLVADGKLSKPLLRRKVE